MPSGVHLKSIETYDLIFSKIEVRKFVKIFVNIQDSLAADLSVYCMGLFPFFEYASTQVKVNKKNRFFFFDKKPRILELFEKYFLKLGKGLLPCLPGLVVCLLPGLEEETSEFYPRVSFCRLFFEIDFNQGIEVIRRDMRSDRPPLFLSRFMASDFGHAFGTITCS